MALAAAGPAVTLDLAAQPADLQARGLRGAAGDDRRPRAATRRAAGGERPGGSPGCLQDTRPRGARAARGGWPGGGHPLPRRDRALAVHERVARAGLPRRRPGDARLPDGHRAHHQAGAGGRRQGRGPAASGHARRATERQFSELAGEIHEQLFACTGYPRLLALIHQVLGPVGRRYDARARVPVR